MQAIDLFAGLGGFTEGGRQSGLDVRFAANHWPIAVDWHKRNHPEVQHVCQDLMHFDWTRLPEMDVLVASPSCKGLSEAGQPARKGTGGSHSPNPDTILRAHGAHRNTTWAVVSAAEARMPRAIIVENVPALLRWRLYPVWRQALETLGYNVTEQVLCTADFGSPQQRRRAVVVAALSRPVHLARQTAPHGTIASILDPDDHPSNRWAEIASKSERMIWRMRKAQREAGSRCVWNNVSESAGRPLDGLLPTITQKGGSQLNLLDGDRCRVLNPRELARGQSFPEHYQIPEDRDLASQLIGNAIDVRMANAVAAQVVEAL